LKRLAVCYFASISCANYEFVYSLTKVTSQLRWFSASCRFPAGHCSGNCNVTRVTYAVVHLHMMVLRKLLSCCSTHHSTCRQPSQQFGRESGSVDACISLAYQIPRTRFHSSVLTTATDVKYIAKVDHCFESRCHHTIIRAISLYEVSECVVSSNTFLSSSSSSSSSYLFILGCQTQPQ